MELARPRAIGPLRLPYDTRHIPAYTGESLPFDLPQWRGRFLKKFDAFFPIVMVIPNNGQRAIEYNHFRNPPARAVADLVLFEKKPSGHTPSC